MFDLSKSLKLLYLSHLLQSHTLVILSLGLCCLTTVYFLGTPLSSFVSLPLKTSPEKRLQTLLVSWGQHAKRGQVLRMKVNEGRSQGSVNKVLQPRNSALGKTAMFPYE